MMPSAKGSSIPAAAIPTVAVPVLCSAGGDVVQC
jgi:hypothetical protein